MTAIPNKQILMLLLTPISSISDFAGIAVGISLAYAALPNFRYSIRIQEYVRLLLRNNDGLITSVKTDSEQGGTICCDASWGVLYRLGKLGSLNADIPTPNTLDVGKETDHHFTKTPDYMLFTWLFTSNLDKNISIALGAISGSIVWYGAIDQILFPDVGSILPSLRPIFLVNVLLSAVYSLFLLSISSYLHKVLWRGDHLINSGTKNWAKTIIKITIGLFIAIVILATFKVLPFPQSNWPFLAQYLDTIFYPILLLTILITIAFPILFLATGQGLARKIESEVDTSIKTVNKLLAQKSRQAKILPEEQNHP